MPRPHLSSSSGIDKWAPHFPSYWFTYLASWPRVNGFARFFPSTGELHLVYTISTTQQQQSSDEEGLPRSGRENSPHSKFGKKHFFLLLLCLFTIITINIISDGGGKGLHQVSLASTIRKRMACELVKMKNNNMHNKI